MDVWCVTWVERSGRDLLPSPLLLPPSLPLSHSLPSLSSSPEIHSPSPLPEMLLDSCLVRASPRLPLPLARPTEPGTRRTPAMSPNGGVVSQLRPATSPLGRARSSFAPSVPVILDQATRQIALVPAKPYHLLASILPRELQDGLRPKSMQVCFNSASRTETAGAEVDDEKSEIYSQDMTKAMGAVLTYRHELGMNYNFINLGLIVGSCLQTPADVDKLRKIGVKTIFCLQQDPDLEYFGVDIAAIRDYAFTCGDIEHLRAEIRDFDAFDLRMRLPAVVSKLYKAIKRNGGVTYVHCTAGLGRAPAVALAYMFWVEGYKLYEGHELLQSKRACFPKLDAIKSATADMLLGLSKYRVTLMWKGGDCSSVEVSGLDIGWGSKVPLEFNIDQGVWILEKDLPEGRYEYKYIIDGEWKCNEDEPKTGPNMDGHINNYVEVLISNVSPGAIELRERLAGEEVDLTKEEREMIIDFLESYSE